MGNILLKILASRNKAQLITNINQYCVFWIYLWILSIPCHHWAGIIGTWTCVTQNLEMCYIRDFALHVQGPMRHMALFLPNDYVCFQKYTFCCSTSIYNSRCCYLNIHTHLCSFIMQAYIWSSYRMLYRIGWTVLCFILQ